jgi:hypothetical protein
MRDVYYSPEESLSNLDLSPHAVLCCVLCSALLFMGFLCVHSGVHHLMFSV